MTWAWAASLWVPKQDGRRNGAVDQPPVHDRRDTRTHLEELLDIRDVVGVVIAAAAALRGRQKDFPLILLARDESLSVRYDAQGLCLNSSSQIHPRIERAAKSCLEPLGDAIAGKRFNFVAAIQCRDRRRFDDDQIIEPHHCPPDLEA
jgi:hypothetical protein